MNFGAFSEKSNTVKCHLILYFKQQRKLLNGMLKKQASVTPQKKTLSLSVLKAKKVSTTLLLITLSYGKKNSFMY
jgi:hypothetical protein